MKNAALLKTYRSLRRDNNDLRILAGSDVDPSGFTLLAILRNEMYFLPAFLSHYRKLGVQRFVFLDDRSDDGSFEFLVQQSDTVVVGSDRRFGDKVELPSFMSRSIREFRIHFLWRSILFDMFARERWALLVDLDEFIHLPSGRTFQDIVSKLDEQRIRALWAVMLDVYPKDIAAFTDVGNCTRLNISGNWYFDAEQHLRLRRGRAPKIMHPGARARLFSQFGVDTLYPVLGVRRLGTASRLFRRIYAPRRPMRYNSIVKPALLKWGDDCYFKSPHSTNLFATTNYLLPIQHFRFSGSLGQRMRMALRENSYFLDSSDYRLMSELLRIMRDQNGSFLYRNSRPFGSFESLVDTRNAVGF